MAPHKLARDNLNYAIMPEARAAISSPTFDKHVPVSILYQMLGRQRNTCVEVLSNLCCFVRYWVAKLRLKTDIFCLLHLLLFYFCFLT